MARGLRRSCLTMTTLGMVLALGSMPAAPAAAQGWIEAAAERALKREGRRQVERVVRGTVRCAVGESECYEGARERGEDVVFVDDSGEVVRDGDGNPVTDPTKLPAGRPTAATAPSPSVDSNYDFEAGERVILYEDYGGDVVGDFPRHLELVNGNWDLVEVGGERLLRNTGPRHSAVRLPLPEVLPAQFTIEVPVLVSSGSLVISTSVPPDGSRIFSSGDHHFYVAAVGGWGFGVVAKDKSLPTVQTKISDSGLRGQILPIRIMADGHHVKMYVGETRVANVPQARFERSSTLWIENTYHASADDPILIGPIRVAAGGRDLYDALEAEGRVAVHDILFDTDAATIRPESAEVLTEIATMLESHPDLSLMVEGHTDDTGDFDHNMELSKARADSVKQWLVDQHTIAADRLRTMGLGPTQPKDSNDTESGKQQNRRVELVRIG